MDDETKGAPGRGRRSDRRPGEVSSARQDTPAPADAQGRTDFVAFDGQAWGSVPVSAWSIGAGFPAIGVFTLLWTFVNPHRGYSVWPSQARLASILGVPVRTVRRVLLDLERAGALVRSYRAQVDPEWTGNPGARVYLLRLPEAIQSGTGQKWPVRVAKSGRSDRPEVAAEQSIEQTSEQTSLVVDRARPGNPPADADDDDPPAAVQGMLERLMADLTTADVTTAGQAEIRRLVLADRLGGFGDFVRRVLADRPARVRNLGGWLLEMARTGHYRGWQPDAIRHRGAPARLSRGSRQTGDMGTCRTTGDLVGACTCDACSQARHAAYALPDDDGADDGD